MDHAPAAVTSHLAALLPTLDAAAAAGTRLAHDRRLAPLWAALEASGGLAVAPVAGPGPGALHDLMIECDAGTFALALATADDAALSMIADAHLEASLRALAVGALFEPVLARLQGLALPGARIVALGALARASAPPHGWFALRREGRELCRLAVQQLPARVADAFARLREPLPAGAWRARLALPAAVVLGERRLRVDTLRSLERGDVLLFATTLADAPARLRVAGLAAPGRLGERAITLSGGLRIMDDTTAPTADHEATAAALDALELPVHFELETVGIPLADLEAIEAGYVIELGTPAAEARLRLVSCGVVIGEADLVAIGGRLGARITNLVPRHDADQQRG